MVSRTDQIMTVSPGIHGAGPPAPAARRPAPALALAGRAARTLGRHAAVLHPVRRPPPGEHQSVQEADTILRNSTLGALKNETLRFS